MLYSYTPTSFDVWVMKRKECLASVMFRWKPVPHRTVGKELMR